MNQNTILNTNIKFNFKRNKDPEMCYKPKEIEFSVYQICVLPNPMTQKCQVRKLVYNEMYELIQQKEKEYSLKRINKFMEEIPKHKYTTYPTYMISSVALPRADMILNANSDLLK